MFTDQGLGIDDLFIRHGTDDAVANVNRAQAFFQINRTRYLDRRGAGVRREVARRQVGIIRVDDRLIDMAIIPAELLVIDQVGQRIGAGRVDNRHPGDALDQTQLFQFPEGLAEGAGITQVAAGHDDPVGYLPAEAFDDTIHDGFLPFEPERIERIEQIQT